MGSFNHRPDTRAQTYQRYRPGVRNSVRPASRHVDGTASLVRVVSPRKTRRPSRCSSRRYADAPVIGGHASGGMETAFFAAERRASVRCGFVSGRETDELEVLGR
jgi:hypothetical protein